MSLFRPFEPNPFRVNAFTLTGVGIDTIRSADVDADVKARTHEIEDDPEYAIPLAGGNRYRVTAADLTQNEEVLRDPNRRHRDELLVPRPHAVQEPQAVTEFRQRHTMSPKTADALLDSGPLDATELLVRCLPAAPLEQAVPPARNLPPPATAKPFRCAPIAMLVRSKDRHG